jgi:hypothetical protein
MKRKEKKGFILIIINELKYQGKLYLYENDTFSIFHDQYLFIYRLHFVFVYRESLTKFIF